ncbi:SLBB domain-containing protein [Mucilaginibacter sp. BT774]|uniref:SLBB domain-containing protein n=1 Tax=Mucilaginibacter sp. BT774 TaxID=3062276 RepID=UPI002675AE55|nr:SLBB domain-containing protein [Mucilaginibacter sp. BT774]MDO3625919.1 SLBB domain-containing protein [Mucilaginibacter sp. BT774]
MNSLKIYLTILVTLLFFLAYSPASAQSLPQNLSSINVDDLSDAQILQLMQKAQQMGLSDSQLMQLAQAKGVSDEQIRKLQARVAGLRNKNGLNSGNNTNNSPGNLSDTTRQASRKLNYTPDTTNNQKQSNQFDFFEQLKPKIFGADLFRNSNSNTFQPNLKLATPVNYIVGPDDQIRINVYGNSSVDWSLAVSPEGNINIPGVGVLNVAGKTIEDVTSAIKSKLAANNYAIGRGTNVKVSLGDIRSISVILQGQVMKPGTYTLPSLSTVFNALYVAGGPNDVGSFRQIEVIRDNKVIRHVDLYDFLVKGSQKDNISLRDQDVIRIPAYKVRVQLKGEAKIPALFEVLPGEKLQDVLNFAGGFTDEAYTNRIKVDQVSDQQRKIADVFEKDYNTYTPSRGDKYTVDKIINRYENRVQITGAVFRPGVFELKKGLTLSQLIKNAGGLKEDAFTGHGSIVRLNPDNSPQQLSFNVNDVLNQPSADIPLQREDSVSIASIFDLRDKYSISIKGEVRSPGDYVFADSMKVTDLIIKAGGFKEGATGKRIEVSRRIYDSDPMAANTKVAQVFSVNVDPSLKTNDANFTLRPYDIVSIYSLPGFETQRVVKVEGEVLYPGYYTIQNKNERISDMIKRAGGLTKSADIDGTSLKRDNAAVLGVDKSKVDTSEINKERAENFQRLQNDYNTSIDNNSNMNGASNGSVTANGNNKGQNNNNSDIIAKKDSIYQPRNNFIGIELRKILENPGGTYDLILEDADVLRVPKLLQTVRVNGEVLYPSAVVYTKGKSFKEYVLNAGGYSPNALKRGAYVVYPNGTVKGTRKVLFFNSHPSVKPGSEIYVPEKPEKKSNPQELVAFTTGFASLGAIILGLITLLKK